MAVEALMEADKGKNTRITNITILSTTSSTTTTSPSPQPLPSLPPPWNKNAARQRVDSHASTTVHCNHDVSWSPCASRGLSVSGSVECAQKDSGANTQSRTVIRAVCF
ncbi:hypothetical protein E2C01_079531 [Portunus trituberculatus]|uniref:Uncharacterized protein n=1 Tax=Portunus trituberculatus TaxID=210409 RepID=A0A5B7ILR5_PORTR|nr:hypothetical protein [Portunus trituberculatus]